VAIGVASLAGMGLVEGGDPPDWWWYGAATILFSMLMLIGLLTPLAGAGLAACQIALAAASGAGTTAGFEKQLVLIAAVVAIALIGPGEFSVDAYLFGRRRIVIPPTR
jgi:uncharacterized membrane protein YphA (DoxX/SURF4 family)